ncbi:hypothetical protein [Desulfovibrio inopinatus]|uniref:hypothetical protein n=1 Tax=Desulfovibrio inopinatus TaxID=102109 RepID=UPI0004291509|nr:hypothetical protein [Desulfovibrio inopinatus]
MAQGTLFGSAYRLASFDRAFKASLRTAFEKSGLSCVQVAEKMDALAKESGIKLNSGNAAALSTATLEKWLNQNDERFPNPRAVVAFCEVVGAADPLDIMALVVGRKTIDQRQARMLEQAEVDAQIKALKRRKRLLEAELCTAEQ